MYDEHDADSRYLLRPDNSARAEGPSPVSRQRDFSARLGEALHEVPVPVDLASRILSRLAAAQPMAPAIDVGPSADKPALTTELHAAVNAVPLHVADDAPRLAAPGPTSSGRRSRRWLLGGLLSAATAGLLAFVGYQYARPVWPAQVLLEQVVQFHEQQAGQVNRLPANPLAFGSILSAPPHEVVGHRVGGLPGRFGTCYALQYKKARATLYVLDIRVRGLPSAPPPRPDLSSGGHAAGAWQESGLAYVLVVEGGSRQYQQVIPHQSIALVASNR